MGGPRTPPLHPACGSLAFGTFSEMHNRAVTEVRSASFHRARQDGPGTSCAHPRQRPSSRRSPPGQPCQARLLTWRPAVSEAEVPHSHLRSSSIALSAMFPVSPSARWGTTTGWVGARGAGAGGRGVGGRGKAFYSPPEPPPATEHAQLPGLAPRKAVHERTQLLRVFAAAGWRQTVAAAGGRAGVGGAERGECLHWRAGEGSQSNPTFFGFPAGATPARPSHTQEVCRNAGQVRCRAELSFRDPKSWGGGRGAERQIRKPLPGHHLGWRFLQLQCAQELHCRFQFT